MKLGKHSNLVVMQTTKTVESNITAIMKKHATNCIMSTLDELTVKLCNISRQNKN